MKSILDSQKIEIRCPKCRKSINETIGKLKTSPKLKCLSCKATIDVDANDLADGLRKIDKSIESMRKSFRGLGSK